MKRVLLIICVLSLSLLCTGVANADAAASINGETEYVKKGGYVDYTVCISDNPGISAYLIYIDCNTDVFSVDYDVSAQAYKVANGSDFLTGSIQCNVNGTRGYQVSWYDSNGYVKKDGVLFTLRLKAAEDAAAGEYPLTIRYSEKNTLDANMSKLPLSCSSGSITVAPGTAKLAVECCEATTGEQFSLKVRVDENPGIAAYTVYLLLDTTVFSAVPADGGDGYAVISGDDFAASNILCNTYSDKGYKVQWWNSTEAIRPGTLFELPLTVSDGAAPGEYAVQVKVSTADTTDEKGAPISTTLIDGTITVQVETWRDVSATYNASSKTVTVTGTPCMKGTSGSVTLIAASYANGQMLSCKVAGVSNAAPQQPQSFTLSCPDRAKTTVKLFALDGGTYKPICEAYIIEVGQ